MTPRPRLLLLLAGLAIYQDKKNQHMALAYASVSVATVGSLIMLFR